MCALCGKSIVYGASGKKALKKHAYLDDHKKAVRSMTTSTKLASASSSTSHIKEGFQDLVNKNRAVISLFICYTLFAFCNSPLTSPTSIET